MSSPAPRPSRTPKPAAKAVAEVRPRARLIDLPRLRNAEPSQRLQLVAIATVTVLWFAFTLWASSFWFDALADAVGLAAAIFFIGGLALVPSVINMFVVASLLMDRRPPRRALAKYPALSVLSTCATRRQSLARRLKASGAGIPRTVRGHPIDDASTDRTAFIVRGWVTGGSRCAQPRAGQSSRA